jgi:predicted nuclease of predicted toxin-antitoxin system
VKLLADENVHSVVIARLRANGFDVEAIAETAPGISDELILARSDIGDLVLITYDRDFGDLIFNRSHPTPNILIYSRLGRAEPVYIADRIIEILKDSPKSDHCFVISKDGVRARPFTSGSEIDA